MKKLNLANLLSLIEIPNQPLSHEQLTLFIEQLIPRERRIIEMRYGILDGVTHTLKEVGVEIGVTRGRIAQIESLALMRIQKMYEKEYEKEKDSKRTNVYCNL